MRMPEASVSDMGDALEGRCGGAVAGRRRRARHAALLATAVVAAYGCDATERVTTPESAASLTTAAVTTLAVTVVAPDGKTPVNGATVRAYDPNGPVATAVSANGLATLSLPAGNYCLSARTVPTGWLNLEGGIVAPAGRLDFAPAEKAYGPVVSGRRGYVPFTQPNFDYCYTQLPVRVGTNGGKETVQMVQPLVLQPQVYGLNGEPLSDVDVFAVIPASAPWATAANGAKPAFLSALDRTASPADLVVPPGAEYALEFQQFGVNFTLTGTLKGKAGGSGTQALRMEASPVMCKQETHEFKGKAPGLKFTKANFGYHASPGLIPLLSPDPKIFAVEVLTSGSGPVTVSFRTDVVNGRHTTTVDYTCVNGDCGNAVVKHSGGNPQVVDVYHMNKGDGLAKTTLVLREMPPHVALLWSAKTQGMGIPLSSRNDATDGFFAVTLPAECVVEESNDDKWAVGEI